MEGLLLKTDIFSTSFVNMFGSSMYVSRVFIIALQSLNELWDIQFGYIFHSDS